MIVAKYILTKVRAAWNDETGAISVDWVMLTAFLVVFGVLIVGAIRTDLFNLADSTAGYIDKVTEWLSSYDVDAGSDGSAGGDGPPAEASGG